MNRRRHASICALSVLCFALADLASGQSLPTSQAPGSFLRVARIDSRLEHILERKLPSQWIAIGVALHRDDLPASGELRMAAVRARQQRVLNVLTYGSFQLKRRYRSLSGFALWAKRAAIDALSRHPEVEFLYLDAKVQAVLSQGVSLVGGDTAHALGFTGSGVKVAVLDTGIDTNHPDLLDDLVAQHCFCDTHRSPLLGGCCAGGSEESTSAEDDEGHGTSVSGIITSSGAVAAVGVAPDAAIVAVKVLSSTGSGDFSDIAAGLDWILTERLVVGGPVEGVRLVNMSLSDGGEHSNASASPCAGTNTANAILALHAAGVAVFAASGNDGYDNGISFPACVAQAISVGGVYDASLGPISWCGNASCTTTLCTDSSTAADAFVCHSNSDELLDLLAPNFRTVTSAMGGGIVAFAGTSASSPYAAGEAALLLDVDDTLTPESIRVLLTGHGPQITNSDSGLSFPRTDVAAAIESIRPAICGNSELENGEDCDDNLFCNGVETCDSGLGCQGGIPPAIDDGVFCTEDSCDEENDAIVNIANDQLCDDGDPCTAESCDEFLGCTSEPIPSCGVPPVSTLRTNERVLLALLMLVVTAVLLGSRRQGRV